MMRANRKQTEQEAWELGTDWEAVRGRPLATANVRPAHPVWDSGPLSSVSRGQGNQSVERGAFLGISLSSRSTCACLVDSWRCRRLPTCPAVRFGSCTHPGTLPETIRTVPGAEIRQSVGWTAGLKMATGCTRRNVLFPAT